MEFFILGYGILIKYFLLNIDSYSKNYLSTYPHRIRSFFNKTYLKYFSYLLRYFYRTNKERKPFGEFVGGRPSFGAEWRPLGVCVAPRFFLLPQTLLLVLMIFDFSLLYFFIPVFFIISITPGLCMTLALTMGITIGVKNTMKMMVGELIGVLIVAGTAVVGGGAIISSFPIAFAVFKYGGGLYLMFVGYQMINSRGSLALNLDGSHSFEINFFKLAMQGFITAVANPKGWAFFIAMVPAFINYEANLIPQMSALVIIILIIEFISLMIYATGGQALGIMLKKQNNIRLINGLAGFLMVGVGVWLALS